MEHIGLSRIDLANEITSMVRRTRRSVDPGDVTTERESPNMIIDGFRVFIHRVERTPAEQRRADAYWRDVIALAIARRREQEKLSIKSN
jgi:hypothetical protein